MAVKPEPYDVGDELTLEALFVDAADDPKDPTDASIELRCPDGQTLVWPEAQLTHPSTGVFRRVYVVANGWGRYKVTGRGTGAVAIVRQRYFSVRDPNG